MIGNKVIIISRISLRIRVVTERRSALGCRGCTYSAVVCVVVAGVTGLATMMLLDSVLANFVS